MHLQQLHSTSLYTIILFHHLHDSTLHFNISILGDFPPKKPSTKHPQNLRHLYRPAFSRWTNLKTSSLQKVEIQGHEPWPSRSRLRCHYGSTVPKRPRCHPTDQAGRLAPPNVRHCCFFWGGGIEIGRFQQWFDWEKMIGKDVGCFFWRLVTRCPFHHLFVVYNKKQNFKICEAMAGDVAFDLKQQRANTCIPLVFRCELDCEQFPMASIASDPYI